nr:inhibitor of nuclear factor kappa B kinase subunit alpha [Haliotis discus hannai]
MTQPVKKGNWREVKTLGSGGFGTVVLWENEENGEQIALKRCRVQNEMSPKHRQRWKMEVDIMKRLCHDNVIAAREVPPRLDVTGDEVPLLAMEYCAGGDLRRVLNKPENCCGMREYDIRCLVRDIALAVEYLHDNRIIHRDLKPENIVLQQVEERTVYKLIDLGYAKELDQGSVCTSFVGTLQYLAPELFASQRYTCTVDYWSFGTVVFECIVGFRPFLPTVPPVRWHKEVCQKSPEDICAEMTNTGEVKFHKRLPAPNHLSRTMRGYFEQWLRKMLRWDAKARGGGLTPDKRPKCFNMLQHALDLKIVHILYVEANQLITYPVPEEHTMQNLQLIIEQETKIPVAEQDILLASGIPPDPSAPAYQCWTEPNDEEWIVFLFRKGNSSPGPRKQKQLPRMVQLIVKEPNTLLPAHEQRRAWAHAVYFCHEQNLDFKRLILSQRAAMLNLLRTNSTFLKLKNRMTNEIGQLMARKEHFKESLVFDMQHYKDQASNGGITSEKMFSKWLRMSEEIERFSELKERVNILEQQATALQTKIVELQRSPFARIKQNDVLCDCEESAKKLYQELMQTPKENRGNLMDHTKMVQPVVKCVLVRDKSVVDLYTYLGKVSQCRYELQKIMPSLDQCCEEISAASRQLMTNQQNRQQDIWNMLKVVVNQGKQSGTLVRSNSRTSSSGPSSLASMFGTASPMSFQTSGNLESLRVMEESKERCKKMEEMMHSLREEQEENMSLMASFNDVIDIADPTS